MSQKRKREPSPATETETSNPSSSATTIFRSQPLTDRSSTFIGLYSPSLKPQALQREVSIKEASHKILAWRRESNQQSITGNTKYVTGSDDDGEKYAGKKVERVLQNLQVSGACVVARWYGGVMLGPVRFEHIETVAKEAILNWRAAEEEEMSKRVKLEKEAVERKRLAVDLTTRDESILTLRKLAAEKELALRVAKGEMTSPRIENRSSETTTTSQKQPAAAMDYSELPLDRLRALDKARDATLSFLLKRIDKAEGELAKYGTSKRGNVDAESDVIDKG